jgi:hypothetical protein
MTVLQSYFQPTANHGNQQLTSRQHPTTLCFTLSRFDRVLGGISTNLLFTALELWMTTEHQKLHLPEEWLQHTYSTASVVNGSTAIVAGILGAPEITTCPSQLSRFMLHHKINLYLLRRPPLLSRVVLCYSYNV